MKGSFSTLVLVAVIVTILISAGTFFLITRTQDRTQDQIKEQQPSFTESKTTTTSPPAEIEQQLMFELKTETYSTVRLRHQENTLYLFSNSEKNKGLYVLDLDGKLKWHNSEVVSSKLDFWKDRIYTLCSNTRFIESLCVLNLNGEKIWEFKPPKSEYTDAAFKVGSDGTVYAIFTTYGKLDGVLYAIDKDGKQKWKSETNKNWFFKIDDDGTLYALRYSDLFENYLQAINPDGTLKWEYTGDIVESFELGKTEVYADSRDFLVVMTKEGKLKWKDITIFGDYLIIGKEGNLLYYTPSDYTKLATVKSDGTVVKKLNVGDLDFPILSKPPDFGINPYTFGEDGTLYLINQSLTLFAITPENNIKWKYTFPLSGSELHFSGHSRIYIDDSTIYIAVADTGTFYTLTLDGKLKNSYQLDFRGLESVKDAVLINGIVYYSGSVWDKDSNTAIEGLYKARVA